MISCSVQMSAHQGGLSGCNPTPAVRLSISTATQCDDVYRIRRAKDVRSLLRFVEAGPVTYHDSSRSESHNGAIMQRHKPKKTAERRGIQRNLVIVRTSNGCAMLDLARRAVTRFTVQDLVAVAGCGHRTVRPAVPDIWQRRRTLCTLQSFQNHPANVKV